MADSSVKAYMNEFLAFSVNNMNLVQGTQSVSTSSGDSFKNQLDKTTSQSYKSNDVKVSGSEKKSSVSDEVKKNQNSGKKLQNEKTDSGNVVSDVQSSSKEDVAAEITDDLKENIATELNITVEQLNGIMENLDFNDTDLFDTQKLGMIVLEADGLNQMQDLLFDKDAAEDFKNVLSLADMAVESLNQSDIIVTDDGLADMDSGKLLNMEENVSDLNVNLEVNADEKAGQDKEASLTENVNVNETSKEAETSVEDKAENVIVTKESTSSENAKKDVSSNENTDEEKTLNTADGSEENVQTQETGNNEKQMTKDGSDNAKQGREQNVRSEGNVTADTAVKFNPIEEIETELTEKVGRSQAESIINQITEQIKFNVNSEFKSMQMQLYPEHLGKVGVQVAIRDGVMTAQITAENEAVKKVIESQLVNLKENFTNQGLKVENVEVTIASHSFEENNMQKNDEQSNQGRDKKNRRVSRTLMDEINHTGDEEMQETVMEALGNTVSYTA